MRLISVKVPEAMIAAMHELVRQKKYPSRSELIRQAIKDLLERETRWKVIPSSQKRKLNKS